MENVEVVKESEEKVITFEEGIPGFEHLRCFVFMKSEIENFHYLQSVEDNDICFIIINPYEFKKDYAPIISEEYFEKLGGGRDENFAIYTIVCLRNPIQESTVNLAGPLVIHIGNRLGVQVVTEEKMYTTRERLVELLKERED